MMKTLKEYINEGLFETDTWTYLCIGWSSNVSFFSNGNWNPHEVSERIDNKFVIVNSNKNLNVNQQPIINRWKKKYPDDNPKFYSVVLYSFGSKDLAKKIKKIGRAIINKQIKLEDVFNAQKKFNGKPEDEVDDVCRTLNIK